jgi:cytochrome c oxidase cbb3-type subunit 3
MSDKKQISAWKRFMQSMTKANELGKEEDIMTDHDYDGIKELDNVLPPWWKYGFYITIIISIYYTYEVFTNPEEYDQDEEYVLEVERGKKKVEAYILANPELFNTENLETFTDAGNLAKGKELFETKTCTACHLIDLGGTIGPNLTDEYWIMGGDMSNIFNTISKGGRPGKGMIAWENTISLIERQQLASYIISMQGITPANPKAPEGDIIWKKQ